jgi:hypothetical protein
MATTIGSEVAARMGKAVTKKTAKIKALFDGGVWARAHEESSVIFSLTFESKEVMTEWQKMVLKDFLLSDDVKNVIKSFIREKGVGWSAFRLKTRSTSSRYPAKTYVWSIVKVNPR